MGPRYSNALVLKHPHALPLRFAAFMNRAEGPDCDLLLWQTTIWPLWTRDGRGVDCVRDLEDEIEVQRYLGGLPLADFCMARRAEGAGTVDSRGALHTHAFCDDARWKEVACTDSAKEAPAKAHADIAGPSMSQFQLRIDLSAVRAAKGESKVAAVRSMLHSMEASMREGGWQCVVSDAPDRLYMRFWAPPSAVRAGASRLFLARMSGWRGLAYKVLRPALGPDLMKIIEYNSRARLEEQALAMLNADVEATLREFAEVPGTSAMRGSDVIFGERAPARAA